MNTDKADYYARNITLVAGIFSLPIFAEVIGLLYINPQCDGPVSLPGLNLLVWITFYAPIQLLNVCTQLNHTRSRYYTIAAARIWDMFEVLIYVITFAWWMLGVYVFWAASNTSCDPASTYISLGALFSQLPGITRPLWYRILVRKYGIVAAAVSVAIELPAPVQEASVVLSIENFIFSREFRTDELCAICYSSYEDKQILSRLPCEHEFHAACARGWFYSGMAGAYNCPICRKSAKQQRMASPNSEEVISVHFNEEPVTAVV